MVVRPTRLAGVLAGALLASGLAAGPGPSAEAISAPAAPRAAVGDDVPLYPPVGPGTHVLDHRALLQSVPGITEPAWYEANIPFVDVPDETIRDTYYYRWRTYKEALKYTGPDDGWIVSEFLGPVGYSAPDGGISAAAGHHLYEGRWLRDPRYLDDYTDYWLTGSGSGPKPATDGLNENTTDWAHQYSFWVADATLARAEVTGDVAGARRLLPALERQWQGWAPQYDAALGLYWQTPVWDAMEFTASSYQSEDPYHGGDGFRPTLNAYQYGDARAIATLLRAGDDRRDATRADAWDRRADALRAAQDRYLWDDAAGFYKHVMRDGNPQHTPLRDREEIGFVPWYFHMAPADHARAWAQLTDPQGFAAPYGPTTVERRSPWFMHDALQGCCRWDGPSWPYATSQTLTALANLLDDYPAQPYVDREDYVAALHDYARTQRKDGRPYVAEAHHPDEDRWIYDGRGHSEDYNHSTFADLVLSGLLGVRPSIGDRVRLAPLVPGSWDHFGLENLAYHGHDLSVFWDRDGSTYDQGAGLSVWLDGRLVHRQAGLAPVTVDVPRGPVRPLPHLVDDLANVDESGYPVATATHTSPVDSAPNAVDGQDFALDVPNTRWTDYGSPTPGEDDLAVDLGAPTRVSDVRISWYDDGGGVRTPDRFALEYQDDGGSWREVPGQVRDPATPVRGDLTRVRISPPLTTDRLRVRAAREDGGAVGVTALQAWRPEDSRVSATIDAPADGVAASPGRAFDLPTRVTTTRALELEPRLLVPRGWTARPLDGADGPVRVVPGRPLVRTYRVEPPASFALGEQAPVRLLVGSVTRTAAARSTGDLVTVTSTFDPAAFPRTAWSDDFGSDRLADYRQDRSFGSEALPALSVHDGVLEGTADAASGVLLGVPVAASDAPTAVVLTPRRLAGAAPEDSLFVGSSADPGDRVTAWYNNSGRASGIDVVVDGRGRPDAQGPCCASVAWQPGDRFAAVLDGGTLTSWWEHDSRWRLLRSAPYSRAVDPATVAGWSPAFGLRLTSGSIALDRVDVLRQ